MKEPKLEGMLNRDEEDGGGVGGVYRPYLDDPQACSALVSTFWEVGLLEGKHCDKKVREEARKLGKFKR